RMNMMSFWVTFAAFVVLILSFFIGDGPALAGWTSYAPLSSVGAVAGPGQGTGQTLWALSIAIFCVGQLLGSLNFITTTLDLRTRGMSLARMPLSTWAWFVTSVIGLLAFAVLLPACGLLVLDRVAGTSFFNPAGLRHYVHEASRVRTQASSWLARCHRLYGRHRVPQLYVMGTSHVCQRDEPVFGAAVLRAHLDHHHSCDENGFIPLTNM